MTRKPDWKKSVLDPNPFRQQAGKRTKIVVLILVLQILFIGPLGSDVYSWGAFRGIFRSRLIIYRDHGFMSPLYLRCNLPEHGHSPHSIKTTIDRRNISPGNEHK